MAKTLQELSDRLEIQDLQTAYTAAIDTRNWDGLDSVFSRDAWIDYSAFGGSVGGLAETKAFLARAMPMFAGYQHMVATSEVKLAGNRATGKTICWNPMVLERDGREHVFFCGLWYHDEYLRTIDGWRITRRVEEKCFTHNMPAELADPEAAMKRRARKATGKAQAKRAKKASPRKPSRRKAAGRARRR